MELATSKAKPR